MRQPKRTTRRATVLLMIIGLLAMLFILVTAYITVARFDRLTMRQISRGQQYERIVGGTENQATARLFSSNGAAAVTGERYADIPGYRGASAIASLDVVLYPFAGTTDPKDYLTSVTNLSGSGSGFHDAQDPNYLQSLSWLMFDGDRSANGGVTTPGLADVRPGVSSAGASNDAQFGARRPFQDADGDGIADSRFDQVAAATELANATAGAPVNAAIDLVRVDFANTNDPNYLAWRHFDERARYEVPQRIVSHGGMVQIGVGVAENWNRDFLCGMFNWLRHRSDSATLQGTAAQPGEKTLLDQVVAQRNSIEPLLRTRGGLLLGERGTDATFLPPALHTLQDQSGWYFFHTLVPDYSQRTGVAPAERLWQRFNIALKSDWDVWRQAVTVAADDYNAQVAVNSTNRTLPDELARRRVVTTVNYSDELVREQRADFTNFPASAATPSPQAGTDPGQLKFYLGRIDQAFDASGYYDPNMGPGVVRELAGYFHEMLADYRGWVLDPLDPTGVYPVTESVTRRDQAIMLAVNLVGFAAPRRPATVGDAGRVDVVWYYDAATQRTYYAQGPQPYITQVLAYRKEKETLSDPNDPNSTKLYSYPVAMAVELYNPNDGLALIGPSDTDHELYLPQFAISVASDKSSAGTLYALGPSGLIQGGSNFPTWLDGRSFLTLIMSSGENDYFDTHAIGGVQGVELPTVPATVPSSSEFGGSPGKLYVNLWREGLQDAAGARFWVLVDRFEIQEPEQNTAGPGTGWEGAWVDAWRDTRSESYWGLDGFGRPASWRCAAAVPWSDANGKLAALSRNMTRDNSEPHDTVPSRLSYFDTPAALTSSGPDADAGLFANPKLRFGPTTPLYTMNAYAGVRTAPVHGLSRLPSFPTVGFMLYVPRYAHMTDNSSGSLVRTPAGKQIWDQAYINTPIATNPALVRSQADIGHMPIFDNMQVTVAGGVFDNAKTGRVPWGQLVFDYFTTLDPNNPDEDATTSDPPVDPYRVPGRININMAPWYVLAGLPVIGPINDAAGHLPFGFTTAGNLSGASPAFWSWTSGILAGRDSLGNLRYGAAPPGSAALQILDESAVPSGGWYRLGPYLAQAVTAYRDCIPYGNRSPFATAWLRGNFSVPPVYRDPRIYGPEDGWYSAGIRALDISNTSKPTYRAGFLTLGELANVMGFDSSGSTEMTGAPETTVLGQGDFMKAVSLVALLDTTFLTTRSNTFTIYTSLIDREDPQNSVRSQTTVDRGNILPRLVWQDNTIDGVPGFMDSNDFYSIIDNLGDPEIIGERLVSYFNARYDD